jgi:hypothetical protein
MDGIFVTWSSVAKKWLMMVAVVVHVHVQNAPRDAA